MKKLIKKVKKAMRNNQGSSLVLVIVALSFIGILMGALLTASMSVYKLKLYDYNAKDNFYLVEQAMDEIYAGVGSRTVENLQKAYNATLENVITYDATNREYVTMSDDDAKLFFKREFMKDLIGDSTFSVATIKASLASFISNPEVHLDDSRISIAYYGEDGNELTDGFGNKITAAQLAMGDVYVSQLDKIVLKNVTVYRTADYERSQASGQFTQTISTDIVIARPNYDVMFGASTPTVNGLFDFCLIADSGVEFNETPGNVVSVTGNVYAAADFYNKRYNRYDNSYAVSGDRYQQKYNAAGSDAAKAALAEEYLQDLTLTIGEKNFKYNMNKVSSYTYASDTVNSLANRNYYNEHVGEGSEKSRYNGENERSMYSGIYIDNNRVNIIADMIIVPGTIAVMNTGDLSVYGMNRNSSSESLTSLWADNMVLGGYINSETKKGSTVLLNANVFMKDDTSIEGDGASYKLYGSYYGYGNGNKKDVREFVPTIAKDSDGNPIYQEKDEDNKVYTRGHYNSSAFIINGENATIDFSNANNIYLAGRSYIELSRQNTKSELHEKENVSGTTTEYDITDEAYQFDTDISDYKTGESLAVSSGQFAYLPYKAPTPVYVVNSAGVQTNVIDHYESELPVALQKSELFVKYFGGKDGVAFTVPVTFQTKEITMANGKKRTKKYYYLDFEYAAKEELYKTVKLGTLAENNDRSVNTADLLRTSFIRDYYYYLNFSDGYNDGTISADVVNKTITYDGRLYKNVDFDVLVDDDLTNALTAVHDDESYEAGEIELPDDKSDASMYASGTIADTILTTDEDGEDKYTYNVIMGDNTITSTLFVDEAVHSTNNTASAKNAKDFSAEYEKHYNYVKWLLQDVPETDPNAEFVDTELVADDSIYGEASITPINYYLNMDVITETTDVDMEIGGYVVKISNGDIHLRGSEEMTGIVVTKGDVYFDKLTGDDANKTVKRFNGIIITGGKVYVNGDTTNISASAMCKKIMSLCADASKGTDITMKASADIVLKLFKGYEEYVSDEAGAISTDVNYKKISNIDYSDIVRYENWMKNVD